MVWATEFDSNPVSCDCDGSRVARRDNARRNRGDSRHRTIHMKSRSSRSTTTGTAALKLVAELNVVAIEVPFH